MRDCLQFLGRKEYFYAKTYEKVNEIEALTCYLLGDKQPFETANCCFAEALCRMRVNVVNS